VFKRLMRSSALQKALGWIVAAYMSLVKHTTRWSVEHADIAAPIIEGGQGFIALTWHSRFMMLYASWKKDPARVNVLISQSRDGAIVTQTADSLGLTTIRGSAKKAGSDKAKGGAKASRDIIGALEDGGVILITPDGPRGPRQRLPDGPLRLARLSGAPILPCTCATKWRIQFKSWDKFCLPLPFGKGKIIWGTPVFIDEAATDTDIARQRYIIETEMNMFLAKADKAMGHDIVEPVIIEPANV